MTEALKLLAAGVLSAILCASVRSYQGSFAPVLALLVAAVLSALIVPMFEPVVRYLRILRGNAGLDPALFGPLLRICCIGILTEFACAFCSETGERSIARVLELGGCVAAITAVLPLLDGVMELIHPYLGG